MHNAQYWIDRLRLEPHPEGGFFRQTFKSDLTVEAQPVAGKGAETRMEQPEVGAPERAGLRAASTAIYFLLEGRNFSALHRLRWDEGWHFYAGSAVMVEVIDPTGKYGSIRLGSNLDAGEEPQAVVRGGCWFGSHVADWKSWALVGCTVAPGFEFADFEMGRREELMEMYPQHRELIGRLTRN